MREYGLKPELGKVRDYDFFACCGTDAQELPSRFLLPIDEWAEVLEQVFNSCVGHALATVQECHYYKQTGMRVLWSPGYIYGHPECRNGYDGEGMYLSQAMKGVKKIGFVPKTMFDILEKMPQMQCYVEARPDLTEAGSRYKLKGFVNIRYGKQTTMAEAMKRAIYEYRIPLVVSSYDYFGGAHCFVLYGWDDSWTHKKARKGEQIFALRNSWGKEYEDNGNSTIPISYIDQVYLPLFEDMPMPFQDVKESDWFYNDVRSAVFSGLVEGVSAKVFAPGEDMLRGDFALVIYRLMEKLALSVNTFIKTLQQKGIAAQEIKWHNKLETAAPFVDVVDEDYYAKAVRAIWACGLMEGTGDKQFEPKRAITRAEVATILVRAYVYVVKLLEKAIPDVKISVPNNEVPRFDDLQDGSWYFHHVVAAVNLGLMQGDDDRCFRPDVNIIRAECTAVLNRHFRLVDRALEEMAFTPEGGA